MSTAPQVSTTRQVSLEQLDPTTPVIADNVCLDPRLDKQLPPPSASTASSSPSSGHRAADGTVVVEYG